MVVTANMYIYIYNLRFCVPTTTDMTYMINEPKRQCVTNEGGVESETTLSDTAEILLEMSGEDSQQQQLTDMLQHTEVADVKSVVSQWIMQYNSEQYTGKTSADVWNLLEQQQELLLNKAVYLRKMQECDEHIRKQKAVIQQALKTRVGHVQNMSPTVGMYSEYMHDTFQKEWEHAAIHNTSPDPEVVKTYSDVLKLMTDGKMHDDTEYPGFVDWKRREERALMHKHQVLMDDICVLNNQSVQDYFVSSVKTRGRKRKTQSQPKQQKQDKTVPHLPVMMSSGYTVGDTEYTSREDFAQIVYMIQESARRIQNRYDLGNKHPMWTSQNGRARIYDKCQIQSHVIVFDKHMNLRSSCVRVTQEKEAGGPIFGKEKETDTFVTEIISDMCDGGFVVFGYPVNSNDAGARFVCVPEAMYVKGLSDALEAIDLVPLVRLTKSNKLLRKPICIAMFGEQMIGKVDGEKKVCLFLYDRRSYKSAKNPKNPKNTCISS